jgi:hypothetical protein
MEPRRNKAVWAPLRIKPEWAYDSGRKSLELQRISIVKSMALKSNSDNT